mgnify:CR=1 FL=1
MIQMCRSILLMMAIFVPSLMFAQDQGVFSGDLEIGTNFFIKDDKITPPGIPQYENQLIGIDSWLNLAYAYKGFNVGVRFDMFSNSNLQNPNASFNGAGIGRWYINKKIHNLDITAGYIYDQIGSGIIYRSYEARALFIDNALQGLRLVYDLGDNWKVKAFGGKQKNPLAFSRTAQTKSLTHGANIKGLAIDGFISFKDSKLNMSPGFGVVNRTLTEETIGKLQNITSVYLGKDREQVELRYNTYAYSLHNRLSLGGFSWFVEGAYKTESTIFDPFDPTLNATGTEDEGQFVNHDGTMIYTTMSYAKKGFGILIEAKRTEHFSFRTDPTLGMVDGVVNFLPPANRENTYRLTSRYSPAVQDFGEQAIQADVRYSPNKKLSFNVNFSNITDLRDELLYREFYSEVLYKKARNYRLKGGLQLVEYNQRIYEGKTDLTENVQTVVPFVEVLYKLNRKKSLRLEAQYMDTEQDFGSWIFVLLEYGIAPHWIFTVSDMYNVDPAKGDKLHYPTAGVVYNYKSNRVGFSYVRQVEGIVCAGGVCRLEPAFSGFKLSINSTF